MNPTEMMMIDWLNLDKLDVPYDLLVSSSMGCGGHGNKKEDDTMIRKYKKQVDGIEVNKENIPSISEKLVNAGTCAFEWNVKGGELYISEYYDWDFKYEFGQDIRITEEGVSIPTHKEYEIYILGKYNERMKAFDKLYEAANVKECSYIVNKPYDWELRLKLKDNPRSNRYNVPNTILVFDDEGYFVEAINYRDSLAFVEIENKGYVRVE